MMDSNDKLDFHRMETGTRGVEAMAEALHASHRTTLALVAETMLKALYRWACECEADSNLTDPRNEVAIEKTIQQLRPSDLPYGDDSHLSMYSC